MIVDRPNNYGRLSESRPRTGHPWQPNAPTLLIVGVFVPSAMSFLWWRDFAEGLRGAGSEAWQLSCGVRTAVPGERLNAVDVDVDDVGCFNEVYSMLAEV